MTSRRDLNAALLLAARENNFAGVRRALDAGANVDAQDSLGFAAVQLAVRNDNLALLELLARYGADLRLGGDDAPPLLHAATAGNLQAVSLLALFCGDLEPPRAGECGPLERALQRRHWSTVQWLLDHGADPLAVDAEGVSLADRCEQAGGTEAAGVLRQHPATRGYLPAAPEATPASAGLSGLARWRARRHERRQRDLDAGLRDAIAVRDAGAALAQLRRGADPGVRMIDAVANQQDTPAIFMAMRMAARVRGALAGHSVLQREEALELVFALLRSGSARWQRAPLSGNTLLHEAAACDDSDLGLRLLDLQPFREQRNLSNQALDRPLHLATAGGQLELMARLIALGADVNAVNRSGYTPLHVAARHGLVAPAQLLLQHGANLRLRTRNGRELRDMVPLGHGIEDEFMALVTARAAIDNARSIFSPSHPLATATDPARTPGRTRAAPSGARLPPPASRRAS